MSSSKNKYNLAMVDGEFWNEFDHSKPNISVLALAKRNRYFTFEKNSIQHHFHQFLKFALYNVQVEKLMFCSLIIQQNTNKIIHFKFRIILNNIYTHQFHQNLQNHYFLHFLIYHTVPVQLFLVLEVFQLFAVVTFYQIIIWFDSW